jgi:hypothetical protein
LDGTNSSAIPPAPRFHSLCFGTPGSVYPYDREVRVGADLPSSGVTYYEVPREYGVTKYRYTVVNDRTVLVDPRIGLFR